MAYCKVILNGDTLIDLTSDTVAAANLHNGYTAHGADGESVLGTASIGTPGLVDIVEQLPGGGESHNIIGIDIGDTTAAASDVASGKYFYTAQGTKTAGTANVVNTSSLKSVNFFDYDGTVLYSYTAQQAQELSSLPANPTHTGMTAQGWNWTLSDIKSHLTSYPTAIITVGQTYTTAS